MTIPLRSLLASLVALVALLAPGAARAQDTLAYKWQSGQTLKYRVSDDRETAGGTPESPERYAQKQRIEISLLVKDVGADGAATVECRYTRWKIDIETRGRTYSFDSDTPAEPVDPNTPEGVRPYNFNGIRKMLDKPFTLVIEPSGKVRDARDSAVQIPAQRLRSSFDAIFYLLPDKAVSVGDTWTRPDRQMDVTVNREFTYRGASGTTARIDWGATFTLTADPRGPKRQLLPGNKASGVVEFDTAAGRIKHSALTLNYSVKTGSDQSEETTSEVITTGIDLID